MNLPEWMVHIGRRTFVFAERFQFVAWTLATIVAFFVFFYLYNEKPYLSYRGEPFRVQRQYLRAGDVVPIVITRCNGSNREQIYQVTRVLEDVQNRRQIQLSDSIASIRPGCVEEISVANQLPSNLPNGRYRIVGLSQIQSSFRIVFVGWTTEIFEVGP